METKIKKIGVLTSGGDAPGMNAGIRAVTRTAVCNGIKVVGINRGFDGLICGDTRELARRDVSEIMNRGGTILRTARCPEMTTPQGQAKAAKVYEVLGLDALIVLGGDGSFRGCRDLVKLGVNVVGIPATIDLDLDCTEYTIGFDTAVNTGTDAINRLRDTSSSHERCSVIEVMGREKGAIALWCALVSGAEDVLVPEEKDTINHNKVIQQVFENRNLGKWHDLIVVAEGVGGSFALADEIQSVTGIEARATVLGHIQRGGSPTAVDKMHASMMGYKAVMALIEGRRNIAVTYNKGEYVIMDINEALEMKREYSGELYDIIKILSV